MMEPGPARAKANWLRLFSRVRLQLQEVELLRLNPPRFPQRLFFKIFFYEC